MYLICSEYMRYVNRRRLLIVVVLAALFGAVLPYAQLEFRLWQARNIEPPVLKGYSDSDRAFAAELQADSNTWYILKSRFGWPFAAVYYTATIESPVFAEITRFINGRPIEPPFYGLGFPRGVIWGGVLGNITLSILLFAALYSSLAYWRAKRCIRRGLCISCGYLSNGAAVCPECGAGVKA